jgi:ribonuclease D
MEIITTTEALAGFCTAITPEDFITVDTEFMRDSTFWPKLCLIQVAGGVHEAIIDPLVEGLDLKPFYDLMADEGVIKVFHAARQDVEIFFQFGGVIPKPMVDTQIAAMVCGYGDSIGYENLIRKTLNIGIDKSHRFTDWSRRPLKQAQLDYALADVTHLRDAWPIMRDEIEKRDRMSWMAEEVAVLASEDTYTLHPENAWTRLKSKGFKKRPLAVLMEVAAWRESQAQTRDIPRGRILKDDALYEIARHAPKTKEDLDDFRAVHKGFSKSRHAVSLLEAVSKGIARPVEDLPEMKKVEPLPPGLGPIVELLKVLLRRESEIHDVAHRLIANVADIERIAADDNADVPALRGWRREIFGKAALDLKHGRLALSVADTKGGPQIRLIDVSTEE